MEDGSVIVKMDGKEGGEERSRVRPVGLVLRSFGLQGDWRGW